MRIFLFLFIIATVIFETSLFPFSITLITLFLITLLFESDSPLFAFVAGILLDLFSSRMLGVSSLFFLLFIFILKRYHLKFYPGRLLFQLLFILAGIFFSQLLFYGAMIDWKIFIGMGILTGLLLFIIKRMFADTQTSKRKLAV